MLAVIAGTNRPGSKTLRIARTIEELLVEDGKEVSFLDLAELPASLFGGSSYRVKPAGFRPFQQAMLAANGILTVVPEYNGSFPGILKYFVDMLQFPESLYEKPSAFVGVSSGRWGAVRAVEQLEMVYQYRHAHLFGRRVFIPGVSAAYDDTGHLADPDVMRRLADMVRGFSDFCDRLGVDADDGP
jgi:NAD(P)H-dependent FMN reductase